MKIRELIINLKEIFDCHAKYMKSAEQDFIEKKCLLVKEFNEKLGSCITFYNGIYIGLKSFSGITLFKINTILFESREIDDVVKLVNRVVQTQKKFFSYKYNYNGQIAKINSMIENFNSELEIFRYFSIYNDGQFGIMDEVIDDFLIAFDYNCLRRFMEDEL